MRLGEPATTLERDGDRWAVVTDRGHHVAERVVLATPGWVTAGLIAPHAPTAAHVLADLVYGDAVLVTFVVSTSGLDSDLQGSGYLVPRPRGCSRRPVRGPRRSGLTTTMASTPSFGSPLVGPMTTAGFRCRSTASLTR